MYRISLIVATLFFSFPLLAQNTMQDEMEKSIKELENEIGSFFNELTETLKFSEDFLEDEPLKKHDRQGWIMIENDSVDVASFFNMFNGVFDSLPEKLKPSDEYLEGLEETSKVLPDLLLDAQNKFNSGEFQEMMMDLFKNLNIETPIEPSPNPRRNSPRREGIKI